MPNFIIRRMVGALSQHLLHVATSLPFVLLGLLSKLLVERYSNGVTKVAVGVLESCWFSKHDLVSISSCFWCTCHSIGSPQREMPCIGSKNYSSLKAGMMRSSRRTFAGGLRYPGYQGHTDSDGSFHFRDLLGRGRHNTPEKKKKMLCANYTNF